MNHPTLETWMSYLYGETGGDERSQLQSHLAACVKCREQLDEWQGTTRNLNHWQLAPARRQRYPVILKWAMAACVILGVGFTFGRLTLPADRQVNQPSLKAEVDQAVRDEVARERETDRRQWVALLSDLQKQHAADYAVLRKDLETVAVLAEANLRRTQQEIGQLAAYTRTGVTSNP